MGALGGWLCNSGDPRVSFSGCGLRVVYGGVLDLQPQGAQGLPRHSGHVRKGIYCIGEEFPVQRTVTTPEQHPKETLHMQPGSEPRNRCQCQQLLLETWEKPQPIINAGIYRY